MRGVHVNDGDDHYNYDDELYPKGKATPRTSTTIQIILDLPQGSSV